MSESTMVKTLFIQATPATVWRYLTEADKLAAWFHRAERDLVAGQEYALLGKADDGASVRLCWGTVLDMDPPHSMTWSFTVGPLQGAMTQVSWTLEPAYGGTRLTLQHQGIGKAAGSAALQLLQALDAGWDEHFARLRTALAAA